MFSIYIKVLQPTTINPQHPMQTQGVKLIYLYLSLIFQSTLLSQNRKQRDRACIGDHSYGILHLFCNTLPTGSNRPLKGLVSLSLHRFYTCSKHWRIELLGSKQFSFLLPSTLWCITSCYIQGLIGTPVLLKHNSTVQVGITSFSIESGCSGLQASVARWSRPLLCSIFIF